MLISTVPVVVLLSAGMAFLHLLYFLLHVNLSGTDICSKHYNTCRYDQLQRISASDLHVLQSGTVSPAQAFGSEYQYDENGNVFAYNLGLSSYQLYYPFGWEMPNLSNKGTYRYGFQGQEKDDEKRIGQLSGL